MFPASDILANVTANISLPLPASCTVTLPIPVVEFPWSSQLLIQLL